MTKRTAVVLALIVAAVLVWMFFVWRLAGAAPADCPQRLYDALKGIEPFVPASAIPDPPKAPRLPDQCDVACFAKYRQERIDDFAKRDLLLQAAREPMVKALKECQP
jgi:hypothetical protein